MGAAFGNPQSETTFSGVSKYLFGTLQKRIVISGYVSTKQVRPWDLLNGAIDFSRIFECRKPWISASWLWRKSTVEKLTAHVLRKLNAFEPFDAVLQVGTHVIIEPNQIKHFCFTDMTIVQAIESPNAENFIAGKLPKSRQSEAIEVQRAIFQSCNAIFVNSNWAKNSIVSDYYIDSSKIHVVGAGISLPLNTIPKKPTQLHNILFIGRDWTRKGGDILLDAFSLVRQRFNDATLTIIGCRPAVRDDNVRVLGRLNKGVEYEKRLIENALADAQVFCVPSRFEPYGISFLEAQLYGVPPVTFAGEGRDDAIKDGLTGILLQDRTPQALSEAIIGLFSDPEKTKKMGQAGHQFVTRNLTWDHVASRILTVIEKQLID